MWWRVYRPSQRVGKGTPRRTRLEVLFGRLLGVEANAVVRGRFQLPCRAVTRTSPPWRTLTSLPPVARQVRLLKAPDSVPSIFNLNHRRRPGILNEPLEELDDAIEAVHALRRIARAREIVPGIGVSDVFHRTVQRFERPVQHLRLRYACAQVVTRMDNHQRAV